jgi:hypothetical protein
VGRLQHSTALGRDMQRKAQHSCNCMF